MRQLFSILIIAIIAITTSGCVKLENKKSITNKDGIFYLPYELEDDRSGEVIIIPIDQEDFQFELRHSSTTPKTVRNWKKTEDEIIVNGGYFQENFTASGLVIVDGVRIDHNWFNYDTGGYVVIASGTLNIIPSLGNKGIINSEDTVLESFPFIIKNGEPAIKKDSEKKARRTAIGIDKEGTVYIIIVAISNTSLFELAELLTSTEELPQFSQVLNLDGGPSTGIISNIGNIDNNSLWEVPNVIAITSKH